MDKYICMRCKGANDKKTVPYKIIRDINGDGIKFVGQLCENCFKQIFEPARSSENVDEKKDEPNGEDK